MRLSPTRFNRLLAATGNGLGQKVRWRRAYECPCRNPLSGQALQGCPQCHGSGTIYDATATPAWTGVASMKVAREWAASTEWESGDVVWTIPSASPLWNAGENDRVVMTDSSEPFSVTLRRGHVDRVRGTLLTIDRVFYLAGSDSAIVEAPIPGWDGEGNLDWTGVAGAPPAGAGYNVTGRKHQEYFIFRDFPQDRAHHGGLPLPRRVVARKYDLMGRGRRD